jgi:hypothetical protein
MEYMEKHIKRRNPEKRKAGMCNGIKKEGLRTHQNWASTDVGAIQAQPAAPSTKAVPRWAKPGAAAPGVQPHRP